MAVVLSGTSWCRVPAPVKCTRKTSSCEFCDSAAGFSCVHAVRARSVRRGDAPKEPLAKDGGADGGVADDGAAIDDARSTLPLPLFNCPRSMRADIKVCRAMEEGEVVVLEAPSSCPTCGSKRTEGNTKVDKGEVLCSLGYAAMSMQSFYCDDEDCQRWIFPDGRDAGLVVLSCTTASTLVIMRDMAREMAASGCTFRSCYVHWVGKFLDRRDSSAFPDMLSVKMRSRKTIASMFFLTLQLMTKEPPLWAFKCATCQDKDGRFRVVTADGIWLGYLKRLASRRYVNPSEMCSSVRETVNAASIHPSEWVRPFLRMTLKQPTKQVVIKADQLNSAKRALSFLCPAALPFMVETLLAAEQRLHLVRLRALLSSLWDLDRAVVSLANSIVVHVKKRLAARNPLSAEDVAAPQQVFAVAGRALAVQTAFKMPQGAGRLVVQPLMVRAQQLTRLARTCKAPMQREVKQALPLPQALQLVVTRLAAAVPPVFALTEGRGLVEPEEPWGPPVAPPPPRGGTTWTGPRMSR